MFQEISDTEVHEILKCFRHVKCMGKAFYCENIPVVCGGWKFIHIRRLWFIYELTRKHPHDFIATERYKNVNINIKLKKKILRNKLNLIEENEKSYELTYRSM